MTIGTKIIAIEYETASSVVKNDDLTRILDTSDEWIVSRTGIKQRKIISGDTSSTDLGIAAARKVIENSGYNPNDIDLIIAASSAPEDIYPSVACLIQGALGAKNAACFDLRAACAGFIYSLNTARAFIQSGIYKKVLIVATDATTKFTDWSDRASCVLFGDGAGAVIVEASDEDDIVGIELIADGSCANYITLQVKRDNCPLVDSVQTRQNGFINMKGRDVYKYVMSNVPSKLEELMKNTNTSLDDIDYFVPHQSNQRMIEALAQRLGIDENKVISNIENYGNMSAASILVAIKEGVEKGQIKLPATFLLSAFGAGMTCANAIIKLNKI